MSFKVTHAIFLVKTAPRKIIVSLSFFDYKKIIIMPDNLKTPLLGKKPPVSRPKNQRRRSSFEASTYNSAGGSLSYSKQKQVLDIDSGIPGLTLLEILTLTICMAGVQFTCKSLFCPSYLFPDIIIIS